MGLGLGCLPVGCCGQPARPRMQRDVHLARVRVRARVRGGVELGLGLEEQHAQAERDAQPPA